MLSSPSFGEKADWTGEDTFAGDGALGSFTFRNIRANSAVPQPSDTCSGPTKFYFTISVGAGVLRFQDGSLLMVKLTDGSDCIDFAAQEAFCTRAFQIIGGTGRFKNASGSLMLEETLHPLLANASNSPVFFAATGELTGTVAGVHMEERRD